jgi:N-acetylmuramoyl-L-alanine amidase
MEKTISINSFKGDVKLPKPVIRRNGRRVKLSSYISYITIAALILSVVSVGYQAPVEKGAESRGLSRAAIAANKPSVDQVEAAELAAAAAEATDLAVANNVTSLSISLTAKSELAQTDDNLLSKPQIVGATGRGIKQHVTAPGDTVPALAAKFGVSQDSIRWANGIVGDAIAVGKTLDIPGTTGVIYTVQPGDTPEKLAERFKADKSRIITYNDAEIAGLQPGQRIVIPDGVPPIAPSNSRSPARSYSGTFANAAVFAGNRYAYGYCTWYAYNRRAELGRPVGSFWGDAVTWKSYAMAAGYPVNRTPAAGAVLHDPYSAPPYGHVAVVERVNPDGSITVSEMNYAGWNRISYRTISAGEVGSYNYIH